MTPSELEAIRKRDADRTDDGYYVAAEDRAALLSHIDVLAAKVSQLPWTHTSPKGGQGVSLATVLAILRGE